MFTFPMAVGDIISGEITDIAFGGSGVLKQNGFVYFVPFTLLGEIIKAKVTAVKKNYGYAELVEILKPSPNRVTPHCPYFTLCGGCQFQHVKYEAQIEYKKKFIQDALQKIGKCNGQVDDIKKAENIWHYRRRIRLTLSPHDSAFQAGFIDEDFQFLKIESCFLFHEPEVLLLTQIQEMVQKLSNPHQQKGTLTIFKTQQGEYILFFAFEKELPTNAKEIYDLQLEKFSFRGAIFQSDKETIHLGKTTIDLNILGLSIQTSPECFIQNHPEQSLNIYQKILAVCNSCLKPTDSLTILDLYCGIGISTLLLTRHLNDIYHRIIGVESNPLSIKYAKINQKENKLSSLHFECADVDKVVKRLLSTHSPNLVIVNPPRIGLSQALISKLIEARVPNILYISCMPATLARDLKRFTDFGYELMSCEGFDLFPQTHHVETFVHLRLN